MAGAAVSFPLLAFLVLSCLLVLFPIPSFGDYSCPTSLSSSCSNVNVSYPFWLSYDIPNQTNSYCGHQSFMLSCQDHIPILRLGDDSYRVLNINYAARVISLAVHDIFSHAPDYSCFRVWRNVSLGSNTRLAYAYTDVNLTFFFNCTDIYSGWTNNMIHCLQFRGPKGNLYSYVFSEISNENSLPRNCAGVVVSPVLQSHVFDLSANLLVDRYAGILQNGFELQWTGDNAGADCADCERSGGRCGYNSIGDETLASAACFCPDGTIGVSPCGRRRKQYKGWMIGDVIWVIVGVIIACLFLIYLRHFRKQGEIRKDQALQDFILQYESTIPKRYNYTEIKRMTKSFSDKLGEGGCGSVFKGSLRDGSFVAVKILSETKGNGEEFINEVASISRTSHVNIVALVGFCLEGSKRALVYEFMSNGSLDKFIFSKNSIMEDNRLSWEKLYDIAIGIARGLEYLHRGCKTRIVHFDIKPHNILLDQNFCPKISDFGLAKLCLRKGSIISTIAMRGTPGYIAPELFSRSFGTISSKSDVYSYGMMVLEMAGGRKNFNNARVDTTSENYFPHWVYDNLDKYCNLKISGMSNETEEIARKMIVVGLWCIQTKPENRPSIGMVVGMLEGDIRALQMPPKPELY